MLFPFLRAALRSRLLLTNNMETWPLTCTTSVGRKGAAEYRRDNSSASASGTFPKKARVVNRLGKKDKEEKIEMIFFFVAIFLIKYLHKKKKQFDFH